MSALASAFIVLAATAHGVGEAFKQLAHGLEVVANLHLPDGEQVSIGEFHDEIDDEEEPQHVGFTLVKGGDE